MIALLLVLAGCYGPITESDEARATDRDGDGVDHETDCDDNKAAIGEKPTWYPDADGDGEGAADATGTKSCENPHPG